MKFEDFLQFLGETFEFDTAGITPSTGFDEINFDEFDMIELVMSIEDHYRIEVPDEVLSKIHTIGEMADYLNE